MTTEVTRLASGKGKWVTAEEIGLASGRAAVQDGCCDFHFKKDPDPTRQGSLIYTVIAFLRVQGIKASQGASCGLV